MKFLLDTNIFIPLEPVTEANLASATTEAAKLSLLISLGQHIAFLHPAQAHDLSRDRDVERAQVRQRLFRKYQHLPDPPPITDSIEAEIGKAPHGSNDWVDNNLVVALLADAIDFLVTEDKGLRRKCVRLAIGERVLSLDEAIRILGGPQTGGPPPAVKDVKPHRLCKQDKFFDSFREDYPEFDQWFKRCCLEHRQTWVIEGDSGIAALCIVKADPEGLSFGLGSTPLKICTFKVSPNHNGFKYGELLLKTVLEHCFRHDHTGVFLTVFAKHAPLLELLSEFGFHKQQEQTKRGEFVLAKNLVSRPGLNGLDFHIEYGPPRFDHDRPWYMVPIQPRYSDVLFPESAQDKSLFAGEFAFGNAIRKAYLCHSSHRRIEPGDVLAFYRTNPGTRGLIAVGVVEDTLISSDSSIIMRAVARRTVYTAPEVERMCQGRGVLAIRFRQARVIDPTVSYRALKSAGVFTQAPQSIMRISQGGTQWLIDHISA